MTNAISRAHTWGRFTALLMLILLVTVVSGFAQTSEDAVPALEGLDPVMLIQGKEVQGNLKIAVTRGSFQYLFANAENKATFVKDPARFEIQLNGACARMGAPVSGNPDLYTVHKGRIYIFGSPHCKELFEKAPEKYLEEANYKATEPASPEALKQGQALIEKAVAAAGGAELIDGLSDYQEKSVARQTRNDTEVELKTNLTIAYPDRVRTDQEYPDYANPTVTRKVAVVLTSGDAFALINDRVSPVTDAARTLQDRELHRRPLAILRARKSANFQAASLGSAIVAGAEVQQVSVNVDGINQTVGLDPATGRIISLSYTRRGPAGDFGQVVKVFSDFRTIKGITLPFKVTTTFNGEPWKEQSETIESIVLNSKADPGLFERPKTK